MPRFAPLALHRNWVTTLPLPAYFGLVTVLYGLLSWGLNAIQHPREATWGDLVLRVVVGSLFGATMTGVVAFQRRRFSGSALMSATATAIRSGRIPADADPDSWTPVVQRWIGMMRRSRWLSPVLVAPIVAFGVVAWILAPGTALPAAWVIGLALVVLAAAEVQAARSLPRATAVLDQLRSHDPGAAVPAALPPSVASRPRPLIAALVACVVGAAGVAFELGKLLFTPGDVVNAARRVSADGRVSLAHAEQLATIVVAILVTYWSVLLLALVVSGWGAFRGRNWARALLVPTALLTLLQLVAPKPVSVVVAVAAVAAVVLLYLPASSAYFAHRKAHRSTE